LSQHVHKEEAKFEVAEGYILLEDFEFPTSPQSTDPTYLKHFKMGRGLKNTAYYTVRKYCALTPFGPFLSSDALRSALDEIATVVESAQIYNELSHTLNLDLQFRISYVHLKIDPKNEVLKRRLKRFTVECLRELRADLVAGKLNQLTHRASPYSNLDLYCKGAFVSVLRAMYDALKTQIVEVRKRVAEGMTPEEAGAKADTRTIDLAIDYFENAA